jgi:hypothetical protein
MADPKIMCANERWKSVSRTFFQLGSVLLAATTVKAYGDQRFTLETLTWFLLTCCLMYVGWKVLVLLESET